MSDRICLVCKYFYFNGGEPDYSELTPGSDASFGCRKDHKFKGQRSSYPSAMEVDSEHGLRLLNSTAETCGDFDANAGEES